MGVDRYAGFHEFVTARGRALSRTAYLLAGDHGLAEDLVQTALARTARHWPRVRDGGNPEGYVRKVLANEYISRWRKRRVPELPTDTLPDRAATGDDAERLTVRLALTTALRQLPPRQRAVVVLRYYEDLSEADTAELLGVTIGTVKSQAHLGLARMRSLVPDLTETAVGK